MSNIVKTFENVGQLTQTKKGNLVFRQFASKDQRERAKYALEKHNSPRSILKAASKNSSIANSIFKAVESDDSIRAQFYESFMVRVNEYAEKKNEHREKPLKLTQRELMNEAVKYYDNLQAMVVSTSVDLDGLKALKA